MHQQGLAGRQRRARDQGVIAGAVDHGKGGGRVERHRLGDGDDGGGGHRHLLGHAAIGPEGQHPGADRHIRDVAADLDDRARAFEAGAEGEGRPELVFALDQQQVRKVHADRVDGDADGVGREGRRVDGFDRKRGGRAEGLAEDGSHGATVPDSGSAIPRSFRRGRGRGRRRRRRTPPSRSARPNGSPRGRGSRWRRASASRGARRARRGDRPRR